MKTPSFSVEQITPAIAQKWLAQNTGNRTIRRRHVEALAREMADGRWKLNGETIKFSKSGRLLNGQHRLEAVILSKTPVSIGVLRGLEDEIYTTLDQGARRKASDDLGALGLVNTHRLAATAKIIVTWNKLLPSKTANVSKTEIVEFCQANPDLADFVNAVNSHKNKAMIPVSALAAMGWMATHDQTNKAKFEQFLAGLVTGAGLAADSPILALRNYALSVRRGHILQGSTWFGLVVTAWNDFISGRTRRSFRAANQEWPAQIIGYPLSRDAKNVTSRFVYIGPSAQAKEEAANAANKVS